MKIYKFILMTDSFEETYSYKNINVTKVPTFVRTNKTIDMEALFKEGVAVKEYAVAPSTDIYGNKITVIDLE